MSGIWLLCVQSKDGIIQVSPCCWQGLVITLFSFAVETEASKRNLSSLREIQKETPLRVCRSFQIQLALHIIVSWFTHVQLLFVCLSTWQWNRSQDLCRRRAASLPLITPSLPALPQTCCLEVHSPRKVFASGLSAWLLTNSVLVNWMHCCMSAKYQYIQAVTGRWFAVLLVIAFVDRTGQKVFMLRKYHLSHFI